MGTGEGEIILENGKIDGTTTLHGRSSDVC